MADPHGPTAPPPPNLGPDDPGPFISSQFEDFEPRIWNLDVSDDESTPKPHSAFTTGFYTISFRIPPRYQTEKKYNVVMLVRELFKNIKLADPGAVMHEPSTDRSAPTGKGITSPDDLPTESDKLRVYVHGLTVHKRTQHLTGQIYVASAMASFSMLKYHPKLFDWLRRSAYHLQLNCLTSTKIQAVGQFIHLIPSESKISQIEEAMAKVFPKPGTPKFQLRTEFIYQKETRTKVLRMYSLPADAAKLEKMFEGKYKQRLPDDCLFVSMSTWARLPAETKQEMLFSQQDFIEAYRSVAVPGMLSLEAVPINPYRTINLGKWAIQNVVSAENGEPIFFEYLPPGKLPGNDRLELFCHVKNLSQAKIWARQARAHFCRITDPKCWKFIFTDPTEAKAEVDEVKEWITTEKMQPYITFKSKPRQVGPTVKKRRTGDPSSAVDLLFNANEEFPPFPEKTTPTKVNRYGKVGYGSTRKQVAVTDSRTTVNRTNKQGTLESTQASTATSTDTEQAAQTPVTDYAKAAAGLTSAGKTPKIPTQATTSVRSTSTLTPETAMPETMRFMHDQFRQQQDKIANLENSVNDLQKSVAILQIAVSSILTAIDKLVAASAPTATTVTTTPSNEPVRPTGDSALTEDTTVYDKTPPDDEDALEEASVNSISMLGEVSTPKRDDFEKEKEVDEVDEMDDTEEMECEANDGFKTTKSRKQTDISTTPVALTKLTAMPTGKRTKGQQPRILGNQFQALADDDPTQSQDTQIQVTLSADTSTGPAPPIQFTTGVGSAKK
jgi:hypothetical protein